MDPSTLESRAACGAVSHSPDDPESTADADGRADPAITRRAVLRLGSTALLTALAGCTRDVGEELPTNERVPVSAFVPTLPIEDRTDLVAARIDALAAEDVPDVAAFAAALDAERLEVESVERVADVLAIEYVSGGLYEEGLLHGIGPIAGAYAAMLDDGDDSDALEVTILDTAPASFGAAVIEADWANEYNAGDRTSAAYGELVIASIETSRHPPDVAGTPEE